MNEPEENAFERYELNLRLLEALIDFGEKLSWAHTDKEVEREQDRIASLLFAKLITHGISLLIILPRSRYYSPYKGLEVWNLSSPSVLARTTIDTFY